MKRPERYSNTAIVLHWMMAVLIVGLLIFGPQTMGSHNGRFLPSLHASVGFVLLVLVMFRIVWRLRHPPPAVPYNASWMMVWLAHLSHLALYVAMVLLPLTGWLAYTEHVRWSLGMSPAKLFWLFKILLLPDFSINFHFIHKWSGKAVMALIAIHILAALKHHFFDRNDVLRRMMRWKR